MIWKDDKTEIIPESVTEVCEWFRMKNQRIGTFVNQPKNITQIRAILFMLMSNDNSGVVSSTEFQAALNRFAIDNPFPTITTRLAWYGNEEITTNKILEVLEKKINDKEKFDKDDFTNQNPSE